MADTWKKEAEEKLETIRKAITDATDPEDIMMFVDELATYIADSSDGNYESSGEDEDEE